MTLPPSTSNIIRPAALDQLNAALLAQHGNSINAILFYGSCLRSGDLFDGLVDLYLIVDSYPAFYAKHRHTLMNRWLPPNVFYHEIPIDDRLVRMKYAVLSVTDFCRGTTSSWFQPYLWGRFSQPLLIGYARNDDIRNMVEKQLGCAVQNFLDQVLPVAPENGSLDQLWKQGLSLSYNAELRPEKPARTRALVDNALPYYQSASQSVAASLKYPLKISLEDGQASYYCEIPQFQRRLGQLAWGLRRPLGKLWSVLRLFKASFTFSGGLDYIIWKLERHSGETIEVPQRVRRYPMIFIWGLLWQLYRRGVFR